MSTEPTRIVCPEWLRDAVSDPATLPWDEITTVERWYARQVDEGGWFVEAEFGLRATTDRLHARLFSATEPTVDGDGGLTLVLLPPDGQYVRWSSCSTDED